MQHGDLYRQVVRSFTDGVLVLELDGSIRFANASVEALLGATALQGRYLHDFLDDDGRRQSVQHLENAAQGRFFDAEVDTLLVRADGTRLWVRLRQTGLVDGDRIVGVILRLTDNHETKQLLEEISTSRRRLMRAERISRSGSWTWDGRTGTTAHSEGLEELYGGHVADLLAPDRQRVLALTHPEDHHRVVDAIDRLVSGEQQMIDVELRQLGRNGWMWVRLRALGTYDTEGSLVELSGTYQDITRLRDTEDQLQDLVTQNSFMQAVASAANEAASLDEVLALAGSLVLLHDDWERARAFVPSADKTALVPHLREVEEALTGLHDDRIAEIEQRAAEDCYRRGETVWDREERLTIAFPIVLDAEVLAVVAVTSRPPLYRHAMIQQMAEQAAVQLSRVAERERAARLVSAARDRAVEASQHKSDFLATMSHEIRTPLNGIVGLNELLGATELSVRQQHLVSGIAVSSRSLLDLINDILDYSKIEAGRLDIESVDFEVREVLADVGNVLAESARTRGIELRISCGPDVPDVLAGDPTRLKQVLLNLGSNAIKFTTAGSVDIRATAAAVLAIVDGETDIDTDTGTSDTVLRVEVRDTGMGITAAQQRHIFTPFTQADTSTTRRFGGTGLGLAISAEIVAAFRGEIGVDSEPGAGSTFWFTVRLRPATGSTQDATTAAARKALGGTRVLVVDDIAQNREILQEQLGWWGVTSTAAEDAGAALEALESADGEEQPYAAVLLDLAMPDRDGLELAAEIRRAGNRPGLPLILLTSFVTPAETDLQAAGITVALTKPVPSSTLRDTLVATLARASGSGTADPSASQAPVSGRGRLLVVEDNAINQLVARGFLEAQGFVVETADDGLAALTMVRESSYDAVLMDVQMPRLDGYATTRALRLDGATTGAGTRLPVIAMTAAAVAGEREKCLAAGMDDFLTKPVSPTVLADSLARWVPQDSEPSLPAPPPPSLDQPPHSLRLDHERLAMLLELSADGSYLDRAISNFLQRRTEVLDTLAGAVDTDDPAALDACAHTLRGSASNLGLPEVVAIATDLEQIGQDDRTDGAARMLTHLTAELAAAGDDLERYRQWYRTQIPIDL